jgi:hypothetical protein
MSQEAACPRYCRYAARSSRAAGWLFQHVEGARFVGVLAVLIIATFALGVHGFAENTRRNLEADNIRTPLESQPVVTDWPSAVYKSLQLFALNSPEIAPNLGPLHLHVARFAAFLLTAGAAFAVLRRLVRDLGARLFIRTFYGHHCIIVGSGPTALAMARGHESMGIPVVAIVGAEDLPGTTAMRRLGAVVVLGDPMDPRTLRGAGVRSASRLVAVDGSGASNLSVCALAERIVRTTQGRTLRCFAHAGIDDSLAAWSRVVFANPFSRNERSSVSTFDVQDRAAWHVVKKAWPFDGLAGGVARRIVVLGQDGLADLILLNLAIEHQSNFRNMTPPQRVELTLVGPDAAARVSKLQSNHAWLAGSLVDVVGKETALARDAAMKAACELSALGPLDHAFVVLPDTLSAVAVAWSVAQSGAVEKAGRVVAVVDEVEAGALALESIKRREPTMVGPALVIENSTGDAHRPEWLVLATFDHAAMLLHEAYVAAQLARGISRVSNPSMVAWEMLPESLKESSRLHVSDYEMKAHRIGCKIAPAPAGRKPSAFAFTQQELESLAIDEHVRWLGERNDAGWEHGPVKDVAGKKSPDMLEWSKLDEPAKQKDRDLIAKMPEILASMGYELVRSK